MRFLEQARTIGRQGRVRVAMLTLSLNAWYLRRQIKSRQVINVVIGAGPSKIDGWILTDIGVLDITKPGHWGRLFAPMSIDRLVAEHVFEHLTAEECKSALQLAHEYLKPGGRIRIAVPDGFRRDAAYVTMVTPPKDGHQMLFTLPLLTRFLEEAGFIVHPQEYFDEHEQFHSHTWSAEDGLIRRSTQFDRREAFKRDNFYYTSLIVDGLKPATPLGDISRP